MKTFQIIEIDPESEVVLPEIADMANKQRVRVDTNGIARVWQSMALTTPT